MQEGSIGRRYARALAESVGGQDHATLAAIESEMTALGALMGDRKGDFRQAMLNPSFRQEQRRAILDSIADTNKFHALTRVFLRLLVEKDRLPFLAMIAIAFRAEVDERIGRVRAQITSAKALDEASLSGVVKALEKRTAKKVVPEVEVDPHVISGIRASIGGLVFDGTIRAQIDRLRAELR